jgi:PAS domain S-box-containing protein
MFKADPGNIFFRCVEDSNDAIMISDRGGVLVYVNPAWCRVYGYTKEEAIGNSPRLLHSGLQTSEFYRDMWASIQDLNRGYWKGELVNKAKDGTLVPVLLTITPFKNEDGSILGYMAIAVDITYKKELEAKVAHQDRLASIGLLASGLAHEVGTPLGVVRGRAEFLMMKAPDEAFKPAGAGRRCPTSAGAFESRDEFHSRNSEGYRERSKNWTLRNSKGDRERRIR